MSQVDFENVKNQTGFCGAWCGSCVAGNGVLKLLTQRYRRLIEAYGLKEWGPKDVNYDEFSKALLSIQQMPSCTGCRRGGGREKCEIRSCAESRGLETCSDCCEGGSCPHPEILDYMRTGARAAGVIFRDDRPGGEDPIEEWVSRISSAWPCSVLFDEEG